MGTMKKTFFICKDEGSLVFLKKKKKKELATGKQKKNGPDFGCDCQKGPNCKKF